MNLCGKQIGESSGGGGGKLECLTMPAGWWTGVSLRTAKLLKRMMAVIFADTVKKPIHAPIALSSRRPTSMLASTARAPFRSLNLGSEKCCACFRDLCIWCCVIAGGSCVSRTHSKGSKKNRVSTSPVVIQWTVRNATWIQTGASEEAPDVLIRPV